MRDDEPVDALASLEREIEPPSSLERRIARRLRQEGIVRRRPLLRALAAAAAIGAIFAAGWFTGRAIPTQTPVTGERYALLLYGEVAAPSAELVAEYSAWARTARAAGRHLTGERLERASHVIGAGAAGDEPQGFFVFTAASPEDARALAASHPHIRRGGRVVLKRILPT